MKIFAHLCLLCCFCLWLIPLGQFIAKNQQDKACGGQRAICMCLAPGAKKADSGKMIVTSNAAANQKEAPSGGAGNYFESANVLRKLTSVASLNLPFDINFPSLLIVRNIEHIPKV